MLLDNATGNVLNSQNFDAINTTIGVSDVAAGVQAFRIYPNPATEEATVLFNLDKSASVTINVYDALGRVVYTAPAQQMNSGTQQVTVPVATLASGVYNVVLSTGNGSVTERLSVVK
jgi:flagellar hook assembly protein FlgD